MPSHPHASDRIRRWAGVLPAVAFLFLAVMRKETGTYGTAQGWRRIL